MIVCCGDTNTTVGTYQFFRKILLNLNHNIDEWFLSKVSKMFTIRIINHSTQI